jgi:hypothetical protein
MLSLHDSGAGVGNRREWLRLGGLGACGLALPALLRQRQAAGAQVVGSGGRARHCIVLFLLGGPPQHETWDPKPDAPAEIRGDLGPIRTAAPGFWVGELMPQTARLAHHICALRAVSTRDNAHSTSGYAMSTGVAHRPLGVEGAAPGPPNDWPCLGGVVRALRQAPGAIPAAVTLPEVAANDGNKTWPGQNAGWLGRSRDPWLIEGDPAADDFGVRDLVLAGRQGQLRLSRRRALLEQVDRQLGGIADSGSLESHDAWQRQAFRLLTSPQARQAFDLGQERAPTRDRYGRNRFGQSVLLARRLVEAGVSLVQVNWTRIAGALNNGHWDTHQKNSEALRRYLMPRMDQAYSALLEDLQQRGLLQETLVVLLGEFGRTPKINRNAGRDHWGSVFSLALAGGGVQGGQFVGASDRIGAQPVEGRATPADVTATVFHALGYSPQSVIYDRLRRPIPISQGRPVSEAFA